MKSILTCIFLGVSSFSIAETRHALIIGNNAYQNARALVNPKNDATAVAESLKGLGFAVVSRTDADLKTMKGALREFIDALPQGGTDTVALVFYAGHGVQMNGKNYLVPVDAKMDRDFEVPDETLAMDSVLRGMESTGSKLNILVLDCCRDNPFSRSWRGGRSTSGAGLAMTKETPQGMFIAYATSPDAVAQDGEGEHSPYTEALLKHLSTPALSFEEVFKAVGRDVSAQTNNLQRPWFNSMFYGSFTFANGGTAQPVMTTVATAPPSLSSLAMVTPPQPVLSSGGLRVESSPSGLSFTVVSMNTETEKTQADLEDKRTELLQLKTEYAIKGLPAERNRFLKSRIGELEDAIKPVESVVGHLPPPLTRSGTTPSVLEGLLAGSYRVTTRCEGWPAQHQMVSVSSNGGGSTKAEFRGGSLKVTSEPAGANISLGGKTVGTTPLDLASLPPGEKTLKVSKEGYSTKTLTATVQAGEPVSVSAKLMKLDFDGTWSGKVNARASNGDKATNACTVTISANRVKVTLPGDGHVMSMTGERSGNKISCSGRQPQGTAGPEFSPTWTCTWTFTLGDDGKSLEHDCFRRFIAGIFEGVTATETGTLHRSN